MRKTKSFRIGIFLAICFLALLLTAQLGFISPAWAKKPDKPLGQDKEQEYHTVYGYAMLANRDGDRIQSDGRGQYIDCTLEGKNGEDFVEIEIYNDGSLKHVEVYCGKITHHHPEHDESTRRVHFGFNVSGISVEQTEPLGYEGGGNAVHQILRWYRQGNRYFQRDLNEENTYIDGTIIKGTVHAVINIDPNGTDRFQFVVDPFHDGQDIKAITQDAVDAFYDNDKNIDYWNTSKFGEPGQIIYSLYYGDGGFDKRVVEQDLEGNPVTWEFTTREDPLEGPVILGAYRQRPGPPGIVELARYDAVPFQLIVSLKSLENYPAPGKHNSLSTLWGKIKTQ